MAPGRGDSFDLGMPQAYLEFLQALLKRGFVNIPRMLFDYASDLGLDYDAIGRIFAVMACVGGPAESAFGSYILSRRANPHDFDQLRGLILDLEQKDLVLCDDKGDALSFSFVPLFSRMSAIWDVYRGRYEQEVAAAGMPDPGILAAQQALGRPLNDREVADIQDWIETYGYEADMIQTIIHEGQRQGVTRMTYLNQIARQWYEEGVRTPSDAESYLNRYRKSAGKHRSIIQYLGIKRQLTGAEQGLLEKWTDEWGFSNEVIIRACAESTGSQNPLQYVNRVLESWRERGVKTVADADQLMNEHKRRARPGEGVKSKPDRKPPGRSNVFLQREKKDDDKYYDHIYKKFSE